MEKLTLKDSGTDSVINALNAWADFDSVAHVRMFRCKLKAKDGGEREILIEMHDAGGLVESKLRYECIAKTKLGQITGGKHSDLLKAIKRLMEKLNIPATQ